MEDFDNWNTLKKDINFFKSNKNYHVGDVWWCNLGQNIGYEQNGKGSQYSRPILIIKGFNRHVCLVVPLTTKIKNNKYYISIGIISGKENFAISSQIRILDTKRLINQIYYINKNKMDGIKKTIWKILR